MINTGMASGEGTGTTNGIDDDDVGEFSNPLVSYPEPPLTEGAHWVYAQSIYQDVRTSRPRGPLQGTGGSE